MVLPLDPMFVFSKTFNQSTIWRQPIVMPKDPLELTYYPTCR
jgi:hypothetical protein